jgi:uncharacterized lipoprotein YddW (UPF0748 family)
MRQAIFLIVLLTTVSFSSGQSTRPTSQPARPEIRAIWVTRGEYRSPADVKRIIQNAANFNFNVILFQVRGNGTVFYKSKIEPWAWELTGDGPENTGKDPGWDPLALAISEAKAHGVELHAWVNVFPAWRSQRYPPKESGQLWWSHPEWFMRDAAGQRMIPRDHRVNPKVADWYSFLSPGVPAVQDYLAQVCEELVRNYAVDGLHFDYIRYPREITEVKKEFAPRAKKLGNWSYDPVSLQRFTKATGVARPDDDPEKWIQWRADQVTSTVRKISDCTRPIRQPLIISAAVGADPEDSKRGKAQSYVEWLEKGYVDAVFTMGYTPDVEKFRSQVQKVLSSRPSRSYVAAGIGTRPGATVVAEQIEITRTLKTDGFAGFSYGSLFGSRNRQQHQRLKTGPLSSKAPLPWHSSKQD